MKKNRCFKAYVLLLVFAILFLYGGVTALILVPGEPRAAIPSLALAAVLFVAWWKRRQKERAKGAGGAADPQPAGVRAEPVAAKPYKDVFAEMVELRREQEQRALDEQREQLRAHPEQARTVLGDESRPEELRALAKELLTDQVVRESAGQPDKACVFFRDSALPADIRLAAAGQIEDESVLLPLYDAAEDKELRAGLIGLIKEEADLVALIEKEPDKALRVAAEKRVKDPELRKAYCGRDGAHEYKLIDSGRERTDGTSHIYYDEYELYECVYCGHRYKEYTDSWHD